MYIDKSRVSAEMSRAVRFVSDLAHARGVWASNGCFSFRISLRSVVVVWSSEPFLSSVLGGAWNQDLELELTCTKVKEADTQLQLTCSTPATLVLSQVHNQ